MVDKNDAYYMGKALVEIEIIIKYTKGLFLRLELVDRLRLYGKSLAQDEPA